MPRMAFASSREFACQVKALTKKNLVLLVTRHWLSTLLQAIIVPILILALTLNIRNFNPTPKRYGIGKPRPIRSLVDAIPKGQQLILVQPDFVGDDVGPVLDRIAEPLKNDPEKVLRFKNEAQARSRCRPNFRGVSNCYGIVTFLDSPETTVGTRNQTWNYTISFDPVRNSWEGSNVQSNDNDVQIYHLPLQLAVDNAITGSEERPTGWMFSTSDQKQVEALEDAFFHRLVIITYVIVFFISTLPGVYHAVGFVTAERSEGVSELIDAMGGGPAGRVLSNILAMSLVQFPAWVVNGCLYWHLLFPDSNAAIFIFWQIFSGLAYLNASIFAAAFFKQRIISSVFVVIAFACLGGGGALLINRHVDTARVIFLSLLFPQMNYVFVLSHMAKFAFLNWSVSMTASGIDMSMLPVGWSGEKFPGGPYRVAVWIFWIELIIQILFYPVLAYFAEKFLHGINFKGRSVSADSSANTDDGTIAIRATALTKVYDGSWYKKLFCFRSNKPFKALDGLDLIAQKNQVLCLLGVNGAGKSTTLDLLSGAQTPTSGSIVINARHSQIGICPQKNILFDRLTVLEHVKFWSELKGGSEDDQALHDLIAACDLTKKTHSRSSTLSGGQKRKLQLACMFVGGTTVCMMDEVTSGLDPISRRTIWNIILAERSRRSMIFTTHFLDEGEVLADHIVILSKGEIRCQGTSTELKVRLGGGYRVSLPRDAAGDVDAAGTVHQDRIFYNTPGSKEAAKLIAELEAAGQKDVQVAGPTIEDVFLRVAQDDVATQTEVALSSSSEDAAGSEKKEELAVQLSCGQASTFLQQLRTLLMKRLRILPRYWIGAFLALALPIACIPAISEFMPEKFTRPECSVAGPDYYFVDSVYANPLFIYNGEYSSNNDFQFGPPSYNDSLHKVMSSFPIAENVVYYFGGSQTHQYDMAFFDTDWKMKENYEVWAKAIEDRSLGSWGYAGLWMGDEEHPPVIAFNSDGSASAAMNFLNVWSTTKSGIRIATAQVSNFNPLDGYGDNSWQYILYAAFIMSVYPCFFALYPAFERVSSVRALQMSNGVRPVPMWTAYFLFDLCFVLAVAVAYTATITVQFPQWFEPVYMFPVLLFHGITGILLSYIVSTWAQSQLSAFLWALGYNGVSFFGLALAYTLPYFLSDALVVQRNTDIVSYVLDLIFPIGNVFRAMAMGFNLYRLGCREGSPTQAAGNSWWGYGFPITYLIIQIFVMAFILLWLDDDLTLFPFLASRFSRKKTSTPITPPAGLSTEGLVEMKSLSTAISCHSAPLLKVSHLSKSFNSVPAVTDVSLSLHEGEILALLGPNGAGKTTIVNMIRGQLRPDFGSIKLHDPSSAIGVCPQFDAPDLLTAKQHLEFYAAIKNIPKTQRSQNIEVLMDRVGLTPHANKLASKLSGGNKRKLSLAIALMGNPSVLVLDEPSSSMDAAAKRKMWRVLEDISPGRSLLLTTHSMEEADALATRAAILSGGKLLALGTTDSLRKDYSDLICVQLVLGTAPHSDARQVQEVENWVRRRFGGGVNFEGRSVGGQVRFMVPADWADDRGRDRDGEEEESGTNNNLNSKNNHHAVGRLIEILEGEKEDLGLQDYSIGVPTLERVFLSVVKDNYSEEDDDEKRKISWWRRMFGSARG